MNAPTDDKSFDAAMAVLTIHHWPDLKTGLSEMKRVSKKKISILTYDPEMLEGFWNARYFPQLIEIERSRYPKLDYIAECLGEGISITNIKIPLDCSDGFQEAFYGSPEAFLQEEARSAQSAWGLLDKNWKASTSEGFLMIWPRASGIECMDITENCQNLKERFVCWKLN